MQTENTLLLEISLNHALDHVEDYLKKIEKLPEEFVLPSVLVNLFVENKGKTHCDEFLECFSLFKLISVFEKFTNDPTSKSLFDIWHDDNENLWEEYQKKKSTRKPRIKEERIE